MNYKDLNDYEILYLIEEDGAALDLLYAKYKPLIEQAAMEFYERLKRKGVSLEDLIQEAYLGFAKAIENFDTKRAVLFYTYANLCVRRRLANYARFYFTKKHELEENTYSLDAQTNEEGGSFFEIIPYDAPNTLDQMVMQEELDTFNHFKYSLSPLASCVFELRFHGFTYVEIAKLLDITPTYVNTLIRRIRKSAESKTLVH